jgi:hypothetical protein
MSKLVEGKVAKILLEKFIIITAGSATGATPGMLFVVLAQGEEVKDPTTGEPLGRWEVPKGYLRATHVQERMTTCEACPSPVAGEKSDDAESQVLSASMIEASMRPETWGGNASRLEVNRSQMAGMPRIGPVSIGDTVREVRAASGAS